MFLNIVYYHKQISRNGLSTHAGDRLCTVRRKFSVLNSLTALQKNILGIIDTSDLSVVGVRSILDASSR
jgi:hypothetical protein